MLLKESQTPRFLPPGGSGAYRTAA